MSENQIRQDKIQSILNKYENDPIKAWDLIRSLIRGWIYKNEQFGVDSK